MMKTRERRARHNAQIDLLVAMLRFASLVSRPMRDGVADPAGFSPNELRLLIALSGEGESAGHDLAELMGMHAMNVSRSLSARPAWALCGAVNTPNTRRRTPLGSGPGGAAAHLALEPRLSGIARFLFGPLSPAEQRSLGKILAKLDRQVLAWQPSERLPHVPRA